MAKGSKECGQVKARSKCLDKKAVNRVVWRIGVEKLRRSGIIGCRKKEKVANDSE